MATFYPGRGMAFSMDLEPRSADDAGRLRAERRLRHNFAVGALEADELEARLERAHRATTTLELRQATRGLRSPEPRIKALQVASAGLGVALGMATAGYVFVLASLAVAWMVGVSGVAAVVVAVLVTVLYALCARPVRRRQVRVQQELRAARALCGG